MNNESCLLQSSSTLLSEDISRLYQEFAASRNSGVNKGRDLILKCGSHYCTLRDRCLVGLIRERAISLI